MDITILLYTGIHTHLNNVTTLGQLQSTQDLDGAFTTIYNLLDRFYYQVYRHNRAVVVVRLCYGTTWSCVYGVSSGRNLEASSLNFAPGHRTRVRETLGFMLPLETGLRLSRMSGARAESRTCAMRDEDAQKVLHMGVGLLPPTRTAMS